MAGKHGWNPIVVDDDHYRLQAVGFITPEHGWTGNGYLFETTDGGQHWQNINGSTIFGGSFNRFWRMNANSAFLT